MNLFGRDLDKEVAIVAEIGQNHEGDIERALRMITMAKDCGADAVKFQAFTPEKLYPATMPERRARAKKHALTAHDFGRIAEHAAKVGIPWFSSVVHEEWIPVLEALDMPVYKVASAEITNEPLLKAIAEKGKPVILSTGASTPGDIKAALKLWRTAEVLPIPMQCVAAYPSPVDAQNLRWLQGMTMGFPDVPMGYSCHLPNIDVCIAAVALGARVLEVHVTDLNGDARLSAPFHDHRISFHLGSLFGGMGYGLAELVRRVRAVCPALGDGIKRVMPCEEPFVELMKEIGRR